MTNNICPNNCAGWTRNSNMYYMFVNGAAQDSWARWQPTVPTGGAVYEILVFIPDVAANTTTWQAPYTINHRDGTTNAVIDQVGSRGRWISIALTVCCPTRIRYMQSMSRMLLVKRRIRDALAPIL